MQLRYLYITSFLFLLSCARPIQTTNSRTLTQPSDEQDDKLTKNDPEYIVNFGNSGISEEELVTSLENTLSLDTGTTAEAAETVFRKKLFVLEAQSLGMDTLETFYEQYKSNLKLLLDDDLRDEKEVKRLGDEAFQRYQKELNVSHAFIPISREATDTLQAYHSLMYIKEQANEGQNFDSLVTKYSKNSDFKITGAPLGWFSVFNLIYPLENVVYATPVGQISNPVRSNAGYHIFKINEERPNSGSVIIQHIWKNVPSTASLKQKDSLYNYLDIIRQNIEQGADFGEMARRFSDDINTRENGGILPEFGIGTRIEQEFEKIAFNLKPGQISQPFLSSSGYHLIRLIEKKKPLNKVQFLEANNAKLITDSRADVLKEKQINDFKNKNIIDIKNTTLEKAINFANFQILTGKWKKPSTIILGDVLFNINKKTFKVNDFYNYILDRQDVEVWKMKEPKDIFSYLFDKFLNAQIINYLQEDVLENNPDIKRWANAFREDLLYTAFYDEYIIEKSLTDSLGQQRYYNAHKSEFTPREYGTLRVFSFNNAETYERFSEIVDGEKPFKLNRGIKPAYFDQNNYNLEDETLEKLKALVRILENNPGYIVEVGGHQDSNEQVQTSASRLQAVVNYLVSQGIPLKRILETDFKSSVIHDRFDWSKNQVVTFQFFSNNSTDLIKTFNTREEDTVRFNSFKISRTDFESKLDAKWENHTGWAEVDGRIEEYTLTIKENTGSYKDFLPEIIAGYQKQIETEYEKKLTKKFNLEYNKDNIYRLIEKLKSNN